VYAACLLHRRGAPGARKGASHAAARDEAASRTHLHSVHARARPAANADSRVLRNVSLQASAGRGRRRAPGGPGTERRADLATASRPADRRAQEMRAARLPRIALRMHLRKQRHHAGRRGHGACRSRMKITKGKIESRKHESTKTRKREKKSRTF